MQPFGVRGGTPTEPPGQSNVDTLNDFIRSPSLEVKIHMQKKPNRN